MHRPGADPDSMSAEDFICDFCLRCWAAERPMVEGHRGSLICAPCLNAAYHELVLDKGGKPIPEGQTCSLCLSHNETPHWRSPSMEAGPVICLTCTKRSGAILEKDPESGWKRPSNTPAE